MGEDQVPTTDLGAGMTHFFTFKAVLMGPSYVGKTSLANKVATGTFINSPTTIFTDCFCKEVTLTSGAKVSIELWDTAGQERFRSFTTTFFRDAKAILVVYDAERKCVIADWLQEVQEFVAKDEALVFLIGTKRDLGEKAITLSDDNLASLSAMTDTDIAGHYLLSAKSGENVDETLRDVAEVVWQAVWDKRLKLSSKEETNIVKQECCQVLLSVPPNYSSTQQADFKTTPTSHEKPAPPIEAKPATGSEKVEADKDPPSTLAPIFQQPAPLHSTAVSVTTITLNQQKQQQPDVKPAPRPWGSGLYDCSDDYGICTLVCFCMPCAQGLLSKQLGEHCCMACCVPNALTAIRTALRTRLNISGTICDDCCKVTCCCCCAVCQMLREVRAAQLQTS